MEHSGSEPDKHGIPPLSALDFGPLSQPVDPKAAQASAERLEIEHGVATRVPRPNVGCMVGLILIVGLPVTVLFVLAAVDSAWLWFVAAACGLVTVLLCAMVLRQTRRYNVEAAPYRVRLEELAEANGLTYLPKAEAPAREGMFFSQGSPHYDEFRALADVVRWPDGALEVGEYHFMAPAYRGSASPDRGDYAVIRLGRAMPPMLLHAKANVGRAPGFDAREPIRFKASSGARFTLFAWVRDADLARAGVDQELIELLAGRRVELEFLGDRAILYTHAAFNKADPETWRWLLEVARLLQERTSVAQP